MSFPWVKSVFKGLAAFLFLIVIQINAIEPSNLEFLSFYKTDRESFIATKRAFEGVALTENKSVKEVVKELQKLDPDFASELVKDEDYWKLNFLLDSGWDLAVPNSEGKDLLVLALEQGHDPVIELTLKYGAWKLARARKNSEILRDAGQEGNDYYAHILKGWESPTDKLREKPTSESFKVDGVSRSNRRMLEQLAPMAPAVEAAQDQKFSKVEVPFATNRATVAKYQNRIHTPEGAEAFYSFTNGGRVSYGVAEVSIPKTHQRGKLEDRGILEFTRDPSKHVILQKLSLTTSQDFFADLGARMKKREELFDGVPQSKDLFVYIHGFNVDFSYAMRKTAQIMYDMDYPGLSIAFSWPARAVSIPLPSDFKDDVQRAEDSVVVLEAFMRELLEKYPDRKIHIIAHSLGTRVLSRVMVNLARTMNVDGLVGGVKKLFGEVILAAPAIDADTFVNNWAAQITPLCDRMSIFASDDDFALKVQFLAEDASFSFPLGLWNAKNDQHALARGVLNFDLSNLSAGTYSLDHSVYSEVPVAIDHMKLLIHDKAGEDRFGQVGYIFKTSAIDFFSRESRELWKFLEI